MGKGSVPELLRNRVNYVLTTKYPSLLCFNQPTIPINSSLKRTIHIAIVVVFTTCASSVINHLATTILADDLGRRNHQYTLAYSLARRRENILEGFEFREDDC